MSDETKEILIELKGGLDRIETKLDTHSGWMTRHEAADAAMAADIAKLAQKQPLWNRAGALAASVAGAFIGIFTLPRNH
jgi:hypothetical protein